MHEKRRAKTDRVRQMRHVIISESVILFLTCAWFLLTSPTWGFIQHIFIAQVLLGLFIVSTSANSKHEKDGILCGLILFPLIFACSNVDHKSTDYWSFVITASCSLSVSSQYIARRFGKRGVSDTMSIAIRLIIHAVVVFRSIHAEPVSKMLIICAIVSIIAFENLMHWCWQKPLSNSLSIGESLIVNHGLAVMIFTCLVRLLVVRASRIHSYQIFILSVLVYMFLFCLCFIIFICGKTTPLMLFVFIISYITVIMIPVTSYLMKANALDWFFRFIFIDNSGKHVYMIVYWLTLLALMGIILMKSDAKTKPKYVILFNLITIPNIIFRKLFHLIAVLIFVPGTIYTPEFMGVSYVCVFILFILIECTRFFMVYTYPKDRTTIQLDAFIRAFTDERDDGPLVLTHIYLLIGCMIPLMIHLFTSRKDPIFSTCHGEVLGPLLGVLILGVGDTMASLVGVYLGRNKWSYKTKKTIEGTLGAIISVLVTGIVIVVFTCPLPGFGDKEAIGWIVSTIVTCLLEATTNQIDNLVLPIFQFALMQISRRSLATH